MSERAPKRRIDELLVERGLAETRSKARALIMAGEVVVDDRRVDKAGARVAEDAEVRLKGEPMPWVSRGGLKLTAALDAFHIRPDGWRCLDLGASTGGFTDVLLDRGAARVIAVDVGYGQLHARLRADPRVEVRERTNARHLELEDLGGEPVQLVTIDCSFIGLDKLLPSARRCLPVGGLCVPLVKPQFEVGPDAVGKGGVVRDPELRARAVAAVEDVARAEGFEVLGRCESPVAGPAGNVEWLLHLRAR